MGTHPSNTDVGGAGEHSLPRRVDGGQAVQPRDPHPTSPDWVAVTPREAFFALGRFAVADSRRRQRSAHLGAHLELNGIAERLAAFIAHEPDAAGVACLREAVEYGVNVLEFEPDAWILELAQGTLGDAYPAPGRMLPHCEEVARTFFTQRLCGGHPPQGRFDLFATEGGQAALSYVLRSLVTNRLLSPGDRVAVGSTVLVPHLDVPDLGTYGFTVVDVSADPEDGWQFPDPEIDKLADPSVKAFFVANPGSPDVHALRRHTLDRIAAIVRRQRPDLLLVADESFGTFVDGFRSLADILPASTLSVYSFSRHFGSAGWRLGIVALHQDNAFDCALDELPDEVRKELNQRYAGVSADPERLRFIDRMVAESRSLAFGHAAGLSLPQQVQVALFALFLLTDAGDTFVDATTALMASRLGDLYRGLGLARPRTSAGAPYYAVLDVLDLARRRHGDEFAAWMRRAGDVGRLVAALETDVVVVLADHAAKAPRWVVRISLADCSSQECVSLGRRLMSLVDEGNAAYRRSRVRTGEGPDPAPGWIAPHR
jgi:aspartate 4-decarboxylase